MVLDVKIVEVRQSLREPTAFDGTGVLHHITRLFIAFEMLRQLHSEVCGFRTDDERDQPQLDEQKTLKAQGEEDRHNPSARP